MRKSSALALAVRQRARPPHVVPRILDQVLLPQGLDPPAQIVQYALLGDVDLIAGPAAVGDIPLTGACVDLDVIEELDGDEQGAEDDDFGAHAVDVALGGVGGGEGDGAAPGGGEAGGEAVEDADGEGECVEGNGGSREEGLDEGEGGRDEGCGGGDEVGEVDCWTWNEVSWLTACRDDGVPYLVEQHLPSHLARTQQGFLLG